MGRREKPLDPDAGPTQRFAHQLRALRQKSGLTYRAMAERVEYSAPALSQAASGTQLPSLAVTSAYVTACGGDVREWEQRWRTAAERNDGESPYRGLARFGPEHHDRFFGRDRLIDDLVAMVRGNRFVTLVGPSGSGKSSLLQAGLIPRLRHTEPPTTPPAAIRILTPGPRPATTYADLLHAGTDAILIVDQFEELFTLCTDARERHGFVELLLAARHVVIAIRADFYGRCADHRELAEAVARAQLLVSPMTREELRDVIVKPAAAENVIVDRALTAKLIDEVADEPGGLPLLSHVLTETWRRRHNRALTMAGYEAAGGVHGALARTAEQTYARLSPTQTTLARRILLHLVTPGHNSPDTRRPTQRTELTAGVRDDVVLVLDRLARARLITLDGDTVDLAHEALITAWPRFNGWVEQDRERLRFHRQLTEAARTWTELGHEPDVLYRGTRLALARDWFAHDTAHDELTTTERAFVDASMNAEDLERVTTIRNHRRLRVLVAALAVLLVAAVVTGVVAVRQWKRADQTAQIATSRQLATQALQLFDSKPGTAMLLAAQAFRLAPTTEARSALVSISAHQAYQGELTGHTDGVSTVAFSPDGRTLASASRDHTVVLWDVQRHTRRATLTAHDTWLRTVAFSPNGHLLATGGDDNHVILWNTDTATPLATLAAHTEPVKDVAFSPDGTTLATAGVDRTVILWDLHSHRPRARLTGHTAVIQTVTYSPDGNILATGSSDHTIVLWDAHTGTRLARLAGHTDSVDSVAFHPNGTLLASASQDNTVQLWDIPHHTRLATLTGHTDQARAVAFSPDGQTLASAGHDQTVILWDLAHRTIRARLTGHGSSIYTLAFAPDRPLLASGEDDKRIILWDTTRIPLTGHTDTIAKVAFSPDDHTLATASTDHTVKLWNWHTRALLATLPPQPGPLTTVAFSPTGHTLAVGGGSPNTVTNIHDQTLTLWDLTRPTDPVRIAVLTGHTDAIRDVAFSPDSRTLASASTDRHIILWDTARHRRLATITAGDALNSVAFSPNGRIIAASSHDHTAMLWNTATHTRIATLPHSAIPRALAFSPDSHTLATASTDGTISLWNTRRPRTKPATLTQPETLSTIAYNPDNHTLATGGVERTITIWNTETHTELVTLTGHTEPITATAYSPDGTTLATASTDATITLWNTDPNTAITTICKTLHRDLTIQEWTRFLPNTPYQPTCTTYER